MTPPTAAKPHCIFFWKGRPQEGTTRWPDFHHTQFFSFLSLQHRSICLSLDDKGNISRYSPIRSLQFTLMSVGRGCLKTSHGARFLRSFAMPRDISCFCLRLRCIQFRILATSSAEMVRVGRQVHVRAHFTTTDEPTLLPIGHDMGKRG